MPKIRLSKKQQNAKRLALQQEEAAERSAKRLQEKWDNVPAFSSRMSGVVRTPKPYIPDVSLLVRQRLDEARAVPSLKSTASHTGTALPERYEGEMAERERIARERKHVAAPISNKGGMQLITNPDDFKTMGRKV